MAALQRGLAPDARLGIRERGEQQRRGARVEDPAEAVDSLPAHPVVLAVQSLVEDRDRGIPLEHGQGDGGVPALGGIAGRKS
jgi:hypothetical protein